MKRANRWTLDSIAGLSLLAAAALLVIWISHTLPLRFQLQFAFRPVASPQKTMWIRSNNNMVVVDKYEWDAKPFLGPLKADRAACVAFTKQFPRQVVEISFLRFKWSCAPTLSTTGDGSRLEMSGVSTQYLIPFGFLVATFALRPAARWLPGLFRAASKRFIIPPGHCKNCGYDLRATPDRCPECGMVPKSSLAPRSGDRQPCELRSTSAC